LTKYDAFHYQTIQLNVGCLHISEDLLKKLFGKLHKAHSFGIQLDETTDISSQGAVDCVL